MARMKNPEEQGLNQHTRFDQIEHACLTDVGVRRSHNQDNYAVQLAIDEEQWQQRGHLFLVADGMGAHAVGEKASEQAANIIPHIYQKHVDQGSPAALRHAFIEANASIHACGQMNREFQGMGTTATALLLRPEGAWIAHVGDSRVYRVRDGVIEQLSYDHSLVWEYARLQHIDPEEVVDIPTNVIHRCLGPEPLVQVDVEGPHPVHPGDIFLLCSDGLSGQVSDAEMGAFASVLPPAEACRFLVDLANLRGGPDNITALIVRVGQRPADHHGVLAPPTHAPRWHWPTLPWWATTLLLGTLLAAAAALLVTYQLPGALLAFLAGAGSILAGLVGLLLQYQDEKQQINKEGDSLSGPPRVHRSTPCHVDASLLDRLTRALRTLRQRAEERNWTPDWALFETHSASAEVLLAKNDLAGAFREYCRAMLPLTAAAHKQRNKEEVFQPIWDKPMH
jgi:protein phosphatase